MSKDAIELLNYMKVRNESKNRKYHNADSDTICINKKHHEVVLLGYQNEELDNLINTIDESFPSWDSLSGTHFNSPIIKEFLLEEQERRKKGIETITIEDPEEPIFIRNGQIIMRYKCSEYCSFNPNQIEKYRKAKFDSFWYKNGDSIKLLLSISPLFVIWLLLLII